MPDLRFADDAEAGGGEGGLPFLDGGTDAPVPNCTKTGPVEICDDGIDNDCNGHTDCDDPACNAGFVCTDPAPVGWDLVGFAADARPTCPTNLGAATDVSAVTGTGAGTCACQCSAAAGSTACNAAQVTVTVSDQGACSGGTTASRAINANTATCTALPSPLDVPSGTVFVEVAFPLPPAACTAATTLAAPPVTSGRICAPPARVGKGCAGTQVCAPKPTGMALCAAKTGAQSCPATFPKANTTGSSVMDTLGCNGCTCAPESSCTETATIFADSNCSVAAGAKSIPLTTSCATSAVKNATMTAYKAVSAGTGCAPSGFDAATTGSIAFANQETVCCK